MNSFIYNETCCARLDTFDTATGKTPALLLICANGRSLRGSREKNLFFLSKIDNHVNLFYIPLYIRFIL